MSVDSKVIINATAEDICEFLEKKCRKTEKITDKGHCFHFGIWIGKKSHFIFFYSKYLRKGTTSLSICHNDTDENIAYFILLDICKHFGGKIKRYDNLSNYKKIEKNENKN